MELKELVTKLTVETNDKCLVSQMIANADLRDAIILFSKAKNLTTSLDAIARARNLYDQYLVAINPGI